MTDAHVEEFLTAADDGADLSFPATLDETKLGADLLPIQANASGNSSNVFAHLKHHLSAVFTKIIPPSDGECDWSWSQVRCAPADTCKLKPRVGDWHLGHACRLATPEEQAAAALKASQEPPKWTLPLRKAAAAVKAVLGKLDHVRDRAVHHTVGFVKRCVGKATAKLPPTDNECAFDVVKSVAQQEMVCVPVDTCSYQFKFGDVYPNRSCRLRSARMMAMDAEE